jgi:glycosyltransferase involved in cell wall biosynthesis
LWDTVRVISIFLFYLITKKPDSIYLTKGSTKLGFLRDFVLISLKRLFLPKAKFAIHLKGGNYDVFYESSSPVIKKMVREFLYHSDRIIVLGESLVKMYDFMPEISSKIVVVENALTFEISPNANISKNKKITFIFLSNLIYTKGYTHVCLAADSLYASGVHDFELIFAGEFMESPDDPNDLAKHKDKFLTSVNDDKKDYIKYIGSVSGQKKIELLNKANVLILPTNYHVEGQPVCIIEAMAYSCAVIATKYRSIPDIVNDTNCKFVQFGNVKDIMQQMQSLIVDQVELDKMCDTSREFYINNHTWRSHYQKIRQVILG